MDAVTIAAITTATVQVVTEYLNKIADGAAHEAGKSAFKKAAELYRVLRDRLANDQRASSTLQDLHGAPNDEDVQAALRVQLKRFLKDDEAFAGQLQGLTETRFEQDTGTFVYTTIYGDVKNAVTITHAEKVDFR